MQYVYWEIKSLAGHFTLLKTSHGILQFLSFDWFTGHGKQYMSSYTMDHCTNMVGVRVSENSREAQILQIFGSF